jgi:hypothetical protein
VIGTTFLAPILLRLVIGTRGGEDAGTPVEQTA